ncbi:recombinase family protein [Acinetobacter bereziniae]|uniref:recombinase family protein n=1 Tax=Acinetobacter bereziniae TaxID=106648 RepID=UPI001D188011|nr:recombinase family protein [Acinetobacter bereziniae]
MGLKNMRGNKKQAIGYVRVSTQKQASDGLSIEAQIDKIQAWATLNDYELIHTFVDEGISGKNVINRPQLNEALSMLKKGMAFVFYSLSRVSRNVIDTITIGDTISRSGADMVSLSEKIDTTGASGRMIFNLLAVLNQFERDQVSERTKMVIGYLRENNRVYSHTPFGYCRVENDLVPNQDELETVQIMYDLRQLGYGYRKIASTLNKRDIRSKHGGKWYAKTVEDVLTRFPNGKLTNERNI